MMRQPTPALALLRWHRAWMRGDNPDRHDSWPECGWYKMQMVGKGPWVPVEIWCRQVVDPETGELAEPETLLAEAFGEPKDAERIWTWLTPISHAEFKDLTAYRLGNEHRLHNRRAIDLGATPTLPKG